MCPQFTGATFRRLGLGPLEPDAMEKKDHVCIQAAARARLLHTRDGPVHTCSRRDRRASKASAHPGRCPGGVPSLGSRITAEARSVIRRWIRRHAARHGTQPPPAGCTAASHFRRRKENEEEETPAEGRLPAYEREQNPIPIPCPDAAHHMRILSQATVTSPRPARHVAQHGMGTATASW